MNADWLLHSQKDEKSILNQDDARPAINIQQKVFHAAFCGLATPINKRGTTSVTKSGKIAIDTIQVFDSQAISLSNVRSMKIVAKRGNTAPTRL